jgi:hypothetical protein
VLELFETISRRVNAVLALDTTDHVLPSPTRVLFSHPISWGKFPALRFGYSVIFNQFSIDWRRAVGGCSLIR